MSNLNKLNELKELNELKKYRQWVCADAKKVPKNPKTGGNASVTDSTTWGTYEEAVAGCEKYNLPHIGFVLTKDDPFVFVDLDKPENEIQEERHEKIIVVFNSYTEISQSGKGLHIIVKAECLPKGSRRDNVELYSHERYMIMTGNVYGDSKSIETKQKEVKKLSSELSNEQVSQSNHISEPSGEKDLAILSKLSLADNGQKFKDLHYIEGGWRKHFPENGESEADMSLLEFFCKFCNDNQQVERLFRGSKLCRMDKRKTEVQYSKYIQDSIKNVRNLIANDITHTVDVNSFTEACRQVREEKAKPELKKRKPLSIPPGIAGDMVRCNLATSITPFTESAVISTLSIMGGLSGRCYYINNLGLNLYLILLATSTFGKTSGMNSTVRMVNYIEKIFREETGREKTCDIADWLKKRRGPSKIASGPALRTMLDDKPAAYCNLNEIGKPFMNMFSDRPSEHATSFAQELLQCFTNSGLDGIIDEAYYADKKNCLGEVIRPCVSIYGESNAISFYKAISGNLDDGLITRLLTFEYTGSRPIFNESRLANGLPTPVLAQAIITRLRIFYATPEGAPHIINIPPDLLIRAKKYRKEIQDYMDNHCDKEGAEFLIRGRQYELFLKIVGILTAWEYPINPIVTEVIFNWAKECVEFCIDGVSRQINTGKLSTLLNQREIKVLSLTKEVSKLKESTAKNYKLNPKMAELGFFTERYIVRRLKTNSLFTGFHGDEHIKKVKETLANLIEQGYIAVVDPEDLESFKNITSIYYHLVTTN